MFVFIFVLFVYVLFLVVPLLVWVQVHSLDKLDWAWSLPKRLHSKFYKASFIMSLEISVCKFTVSGGAATGVGAGTWTWSSPKDLHGEF